MWKRLNHPNIVDFRGVTLDPPQLVSKWMPGGELREYIKKNPGTDPINLVGSFPPAFVRYLTSASVARHRRRSRLSSLIGCHSRRP